MAKKRMVVDSLNMFLPCLPGRWVHAYRVLYGVILSLIKASFHEYDLLFIVDLSKADSHAKRVWVTRQSRLAVADNRRFPSCSGILIADVLENIRIRYPSWFDWSYVVEGTADDMIAALANEDTGIVLSNDRDFFRYSGREYKVATRYYIDRSFILPRLRLCFDERYVGPVRTIPTQRMSMCKNRTKNDINVLRSGSVYRGVTHPSFRLLPLMYDYLLPIVAAIYKLNDANCRDWVLMPTQKKPYFTWRVTDPVDAVFDSRLYPAYKRIIESGGTTRSFAEGCMYVIKQYMRDVVGVYVDKEDIRNAVLTLVLKCTDCIILNETLRRDAGSNEPPRVFKLGFGSQALYACSTRGNQCLTKLAWELFSEVLQVLV